MVRQKFLIKRIDSGIDGSRLDQNVIAVGIVLLHSYNSPDLPFNALQAINKLLTLRLRTIGMFRTAAGTDRSFQSIIIRMVHKQKSSSKYPLGVY